MKSLPYSVTLLVSILSVIAGCSSNPRSGYAFGGVFPAKVSTVAVPVFANTTMQSGLESEVTEALIKELQRSSSMRVTSEERADSVLTGVIRDVSMRRVSINKVTGLVQEVAVSITVDFEWTDRRTGKVLAKRQGLTGADTFVPAQGARESLESGEFAAAQRIARNVAAEMRSNW
jgi:hypothetical protein